MPDLPAQPWTEWEERFEFDEAYLRSAAFDPATSPAIAIRLLTHVGHDARLAIMRLHGWTLPQLNILIGLSNEHYLLSRYINPMAPAEMRQMARQLFEAGLLSDTIILRALAYGLRDMLVESLHLRTRFSRSLVEHVLGKCDHIWLSILGSASAMRAELRPLFVDLARTQMPRLRKSRMARVADFPDGATVAVPPGAGISAIVARYTGAEGDADTDLDGLLSMAITACVIEDFQLAS